MPTTRQVLILAGGKGTRVQRLSEGKPKSLITVAGKPFLAWQIELLKATNITDIVLCVGHLGSQIEQFAGDGSSWKVHIRYSREDPDLLMGTGGAIVKALPLLNPVFGVLYGDSYLPFDFFRPFLAIEVNEAAALMCVHKNSNKWDRSNVRVDGDTVVCYSKNTMDESVDSIDYGFSVFSREVFQNYAPLNRHLDLAEIITKLVEERQLKAMIVSERFYEIGKPEGIAELNDHLGKHLTRA